MIKIIELSKYARVVDHSPFLLPDTLEFDFESCGYDMSNAFITLKNGNIQETYKLTRPFEVPSKFLFAGELYISIDAYIKGNLIKHWDCLPLLIKETEVGMQCFDFLFEIEKKMLANEKRIETLEKAHEIIK